MLLYEDEIRSVEGPDACRGGLERTAPTRVAGKESYSSRVRVKLSSTSRFHGGLSVSQRVSPSTRYVYDNAPPAIKFGFLATMGRVVIVEPDTSYVPEFAMNESKAVNTSASVGS